MDWVVGIFLGLGFLFFWGVWVFGYWLPMAKEAQRDFKRQQAREQAAEQARAAAVAPRPVEPPSGTAAGGRGSDSVDPARP